MCRDLISYSKMHQNNLRKLGISCLKYSTSVAIQIGFKVLDIREFWALQTRVKWSWLTEYAAALFLASTTEMKLMTMRNISQRRGLPHVWKSWQECQMLVQVQNQQASEHWCVCQSKDSVASSHDGAPYESGNKQFLAKFGKETSARNKCSQVR